MIMIIMMIFAKLSMMIIAGIGSPRAHTFGLPNIMNDNKMVIGSIDHESDNSHDNPGDDLDGEEEWQW